MDQTLHVFRAVPTAPRRARRRFTLVELIIVCAIIGILSAVVLPMYANFMERARVVASEAPVRPVPPNRF